MKKTLAMQQERHAIVAQRASPLRPTSRLKARHFFGVFKKTVISVISSFHRIVWRICRISYVVYTVDKTPYVVALNKCEHPQLRCSIHCPEAYTSITWVPPKGKTQCRSNSVYLPMQHFKLINKTPAAPNITITYIRKNIKKRKTPQKCTQNSMPTSLDFL